MSNEIIWNHLTVCKQMNSGLFKDKLTHVSMRVRVFANSSRDLGSIPGQVIPNTQKWYLTPPSLTPSIIRYQTLA